MLIQELVQKTPTSDSNVHYIAYDCWFNFYKTATSFWFNCWYKWHQLLIRALVWMTVLMQVFVALLKQVIQVFIRLSTVDSNVHMIASCCWFKCSYDQCWVLVQIFRLMVLTGCYNPTGLPSTFNVDQMQRVMTSPSTSTLASAKERLCATHVKEAPGGRRRKTSPTSPLNRRTGLKWPLSSFTVAWGWVENRSTTLRYQKHSSSSLPPSFLSVAKSLGGGRGSLY